NDAHRAAPTDDVFSIGQIGWQLLAGRRPVGNAPALGVVRGDLHPRLIELIESMRASNPDERPETACDALAMLDAYVDRRWPRLEGPWQPRLQDRTVLEHLEGRQIEACTKMHAAGMIEAAQALRDLVDLVGPFSLSLEADPSVELEDLP